MAFGCHDTSITLPQACAHLKKNGRGNGNDDFSVQCTMYLQLQVVRFYIYPDQSGQGLKFSLTLPPQLRLVNLNNAATSGDSGSNVTWYSPRNIFLEQFWSTKIKGNFRFYSSKISHYVFNQIYCHMTGIYVASHLIFLT